MSSKDQAGRASAPMRLTGIPALCGALTILSAAIGPVAAQTPILVPKVQNGADSPAPPIMAVPASAPTQKFTMAVGKSIIVDLPADASEVFVGKPEVANAVVRSARRLYIMAIGERGQTTIFALDKDPASQIAALELNRCRARSLGDLKSGILNTAIPGQRDQRVQAHQRHRHPDRHRGLGRRSATRASTSRAPSRRLFGRREPGAAAASNSGSGSAAPASTPARRWSSRARSSIRWSSAARTK